jgi:hypothetical protein
MSAGWIGANDMTGGDPTAAPHIQAANPNLLKLAILAALLVTCLALVGGSLYFTPYTATPVMYGWSCSASLQCKLTVEDKGGGFDHGFNPAEHWSISGQPEDSVLISPSTGTLHDGQIAQIRLSVVSDSCPSTITFTSKYAILAITPFTVVPQTHQCVLGPASYKVIRISGGL